MILQKVFFICSILAIARSVESLHGLRVKANAINGQPGGGQPRFSTPEECARSCDEDEKPRYCYYNFTLEYYTTMGGACKHCKPNSNHQLENVPSCHCIEADGFERGILSINRILPGPSIQVCLNDKIIVDVRNNIGGLEVAFHWHGLWQRGSQYYDGVPFLTQCPITSETTFRYQFGANNPGTHFYHSHIGVQKIDGQYGSLIVRQPRLSDPNGKLYDEDSPSHVIVLSDWMHEMSIQRFPGRLTGNMTGQLPENVLINGKGRWTNPATKKTTTVRRELFEVQPGKKYRFRMINSFSTVCPAELTIEGHNLTLIAQDGEPVVPVSVNTIISSSGERVDFVLKTNQVVSAYWIQVRAIGSCDELNPNIAQFAILKYTGGPDQPENSPRIINRGPVVYNDPTNDCSQPRDNSICASELKSPNKVPEEFLHVSANQQIVLPFEFFVYGENLTRELFQPGSYSKFLVAPDGSHLASMVDGISFSYPRAPPLSQKLDSSDTCDRKNLPKGCSTPCHCPHTHNIKKDAIVEVVIYNGMSGTGLSHPFHLHGYSFYLFKIGKLSGNSNNHKDNIMRAIGEHRNMFISKPKRYHNLAKKDTVVIPDNGYAIFRFKADNPGWWLFHCHFLYHTISGMDVALRVGQSGDLPPVPPNFPTCQSFVPNVQ